MSKELSAWERNPDYQIEIIQFDVRVFIVINEQTIVDSRRTLLLSEQGMSPVYYFPRQDVNMKLLHKINKVTFCEYKGEAEHWSLKLKDREINIAAWSYNEPFDQVNAIKQTIAFYPDVMKYISL